MSTKEPPSKPSQSSLIALSDERLSSALGLSALRLWQGRIARRRLRWSGTSPLTSSHQAALDDLLAHSREVMHIAGTVEFWSQTVVAAQRWSNDTGLPPTAVNLGILDAQGTKIEGTTAAIGAAQYTASTAAMQARLAVPLSAEQLDEIRSQWSAPHLTMLIALGLDEAPTQFEYSCLVADIVVAVASVAAHRIKQRTLVPRPYDEPFKSQLGIQVRPELQVGYSAFPAGHAFVCGTLAEVMGSLCRATEADRAWLMGLAHSIGDNRVLSGLHNAIEVDAGLALGAAVGRSMVRAANDLGAWGPWAAIFAKASTEMMVSGSP